MAVILNYMRTDSVQASPVNTRRVDAITFMTLAARVSCQKRIQLSSVNNIRGYNCSYRLQKRVSKSYHFSVSDIKVTSCKL